MTCKEDRSYWTIFLLSFSSNVTQVVILSLEVSQLVKRHLVLFPQQPHELRLMLNNTRSIFFFFFIIWFFIIDIVTPLLTNPGLENEIKSFAQIQWLENLHFKQNVHVIIWNKSKNKSKYLRSHSISSLRLFLLKEIIFSDFRRKWGVMGGWINEGALPSNFQQAWPRPPPLNSCLNTKNISDKFSFSHLTSSFQRRSIRKRIHRHWYKYRKYCFLSQFGVKAKLNW